MVCRVVSCRIGIGGKFVSSEKKRNFALLITIPHFQPVRIMSNEITPVSTGHPAPIHTDNAPKPVGAYPHARQVGNLLFLSGIGPRMAGSDGGASSIPGLQLTSSGNFAAFDFEAQCHSVFHNVRAVLEASGSRWENLVDVTVFLTDMQRDFETFNRIYAQYFTTAQPCRTTVAIDALPTPIAIELKCIAVLD